MKPIQDLTRKTFGKLTALVRTATKGSSKKSKWSCVCSCGRSAEVFATHLIRGNTTSCGCCFGRPVKKIPAHASWVAMKARCLNPNHPAYHRYGGRGIEICDLWSGFECFYADMGDRPEGMSLDRINTDGNYEPNNCRWATPSEQSNNMSTNRRINFEGELLTVAEVSKKTGEKYQVVYSRTIRKEIRNAFKA